MANYWSTWKEGLGGMGAMLDAQFTKIAELEKKIAELEARLKTAESKS